MIIKSLAVILLASCLAIICAQASNSPSRYYRLAYYNTPAKLKAIQNLEAMSPAADLEDDDEFDGDEFIEPVSRKTSSPSTGRLFFKRLFGQANQAQQQPIIIVTGGNSGNTAGTASTGSIPAATGTITTQPITSRGYDEEEEQDAGSIAANISDEEKLESEAAPAASAAAAVQEYVVTHANIKGTGSDASTQFNAGNTINLRQNGRPARVSVNIPNRYHKYFKNGQKVYLRRPNRRRRNRNRNRNRPNRNRNRRPNIIN